MASPIHNYLFDPTPLPPIPENVRLKSPTLASIASFLLPSEGYPRALDASVRKARSPRSLSRSNFGADTVAVPSDDVYDLSQEDTPRAQPRPTFEAPLERTFAPAYECTPANIPTIRSALPASLPRPLIRLIVITTVILSTVWVLHHVPAASLLGRNSVDYSNTKVSLTQWAATERTYVPPQAYAKRYQPHTGNKEELWVPRQPAPHPKTSRPSARPLPRAVELLALQSYLLESRYNVLPADTDVSAPLDANVVLGFDADDETLVELEREHANEVVVWYGGNGKSNLPHDLLTTLSAIHGENKRPILLPLHDRPDLDRLLPTISRLDHDVSRYPLLMIGNRPVVAHPDTIKEMHASGRLKSLMASIGWSDETLIDVTKRKTKRTPKVAKVKRRSLSEVDVAVRDDRRARNARNARDARKRS